MELTIQSVNFDATDQLKAFIEKKIKKLERFTDDIIQAEVILRVVKPETANNKDAAVKLNLRHREAFANKKADSFEEAIDLCAMAIEKQIIKTKEKKER
ncbi:MULTISPECIES: ribosome hibernation-promoting factor, HPF/YfiA family [Proteiniphilum]|jgi:putative sigma-54 modulation protein|uniref:ribosome hibernation-promoting factor, HPF/YfiA family n=1 Tax=Proteiniphilum TaxID=294702 RepID=UPI001EEBB96D|nr:MULTISPECIES: ribosome-associated translation inhibitor RaiA [Proteiniphilum]MDD2246603.1 ribosome-associated translation inhibitor RaiA [Proteiniphilum sp.]MDD3909574.1 ribosome-associated translation inhibitor RaiA [Proteiniphilum sp.]MDD4416052.1 ribosome-associated translation inhibitor RaiA [Proteiniphilum sp.]ULB34815.1 ribosome-associated translation inhibitor RaiA [Proteiniphilum propionicum]